MRDRTKGKNTMASGKTHLHTIADQDGAAVLDVERGLITTLNPTGAFIWRGLERGEPLETIIANLATETGGELLVVERDVRAFVKSLRDNDLLSR
jgi:Coenzyme PQQ synthesis protein D (PqqD)